jgi:predicted MFS family arabinose efflux permease
MYQQPTGISAKLRTMRMMFFMTGIGISVWAIVVPFTKIRFQLSDGTLGLMLLAGGTGGMLAMPFAGMAIGRWGSRAVLITVGLSFGLVLPLLTLAPSPLAFTILLLLYGALFGALDISLNAQGAVIERQSRRLQMSGFHACFSLGTLAIAATCSLLLHLGVSYIGCALVSASAILLLLTQSPRLVPPAEDAPSGGPTIALPNRATIVLGLCCFACFMTEGAATDWSTIYLRFSRGMPLASAALGYTAFAVSMTASRFGGDHVATRLGPPQVMRLGCALAVGGFALTIFVPYGLAGIIGFGLIGLGTGNVVPLIFSAAARVPGMAANHSVPAVVGLGYAGFLLGPVVIGLLSNHFGLGAALGLDAILLIATFFAAKAVA